MTLYANLGIPMIAVQMPLLSGALPAVIFLEAALLRRWYSLDWPTALKPVILANAVSTLLGIPVLWFILMMAQASFVEPHLSGVRPLMPAPWIEVLFKPAWINFIPGERYWMVPLAFLILLIPAFFMTLVVEGPFYRRAFAGRTTPLTPSQANWRLHHYSYGLLAAAGLLILVASLVTHHFRPEPHRTQRRNPTSQSPLAPTP